MQEFVSDIPARERGETCFGHALRSPIPRGRIRGLRAPALPEGYFLIRGRDIPGRRTVSCDGFSHPVLGDPQVHYRGQPCVLLGGPDRETLAELAEAVRIDWDELPAAGSGRSRTAAAEAQGAGPGSTVIPYRRGDPDTAFRQASQIIEAEYLIGRQSVRDLDPPAAYVQPTDKALIVHTATQDPFGLREAIAGVLKLPSRRVRVVAARLGNPMEGRFLSSALVACHAALLAAVSGRPLWLGVEALDDCRYGLTGPGFRILQQTALDKEGNPTAVRVEIQMDAGAFAPQAESILLPAMRCVLGGYRIPHVEMKAAALSSSTAPADSLRAAGRAQGFFAAALNSSRIEEISELDPYSWRSRRLLGSEPLADGGLAGAAEGQAGWNGPLEVLEAVTRMSNFRRKHAAFAALKKRRQLPCGPPHPLRGVGLAAAYQERQDPGVCIPRAHTCTVKAVLETDKRLHLYTSFVDLQPGIHELFVRRAASLLEIDPDRITVEDVDTQAVPDSGATTLGRALSVGLPLIEQCCRAIKIKRIKSLLPIEVRRSFREPPAGPAGGSGSSAALGLEGPRSPADAAWGATVVEAEVDPVSLAVTVRGIWTVVLCGSVEDLPGAERYLVAEVVRAFGWASLPESFCGEDGGPSRWNPGSLPRLSEIPPVSVRFLEDPNPMPRGFEQLAYLSVPAAYAAAVSQATGLYLDRVPITPEVLQEWLET